jgi:hypothetical protein
VDASTSAGAVLAGDRRTALLALLRDFWFQPGSGPPTLLLGYAQVSEHAIPTAVRELAQATRAAHAGRPKGWRVVDAGLVVVERSHLLNRAGSGRSRLTRCTQSSWA